MRKQKSKVILSALFSIFLCFCSVCSLVVFSAGEALAFEFAGEAILETLMNYDEYADKGQTRAAQNALAVIGNSISEKLGATSVIIHNYIYIVGKYRMIYNDVEGRERWFTVSLTGYFEEGENGLVDSSGTLDYVKPITGADGKYYLVNNCYYTIDRDDGYYKRYRFKPSGGSGITSYMPYTSAYDFTMNINSGRTVYDVTDNSLYGTLDSRFESTTNTRSRNFATISTNTITRNSQGAIGGDPRFNSWYNWDENFTSVYPDDLSIVNNYLKVRDYGTSFSSGSYSEYYINPTFYISMVDTNMSSINSAYNNQTDNTKISHVYNYNSTYEGGTIINNDNKTTVLGGVLAPNFDANGLVIDLPEVDFNNNLMPLIDLAVDHLADLINGFYTDMPDLNLPWTDRNPDNNYLDLPFSPPDNPSSDITVIVTVDVSRPLVPEFTTSSRWLYIDVGNITTTVQAIQPEYVAAAHTLQGKTDSIFDEIGVLPLYLGLAIFGVAVSVLFKGV